MVIYVLISDNIDEKVNLNCRTHSTIFYHRHGFVIYMCGEEELEKLSKLTMEDAVDAIVVTSQDYDLIVKILLTLIQKL